MLDWQTRTLSTGHPLIEDKLIKINDHEDDYFTMQDHLYGDGYQGQHLRQYYPGPVE